MSHDQNFKNLIVDYPRESIAFFAAVESRAVDDGACILPIREEQLKERLGERFRELDVPLLVEWPDGRRAALLFVFEEETKPKRFSLHRLAHYCLDLADLCDTDRVVPVVIFLHPGSYATRLRLGSETTAYLDFHCLDCALFALRAREHLDSRNLVARLNLPNMAYAPEDKLKVYASAVRGLRELEPDPERCLKYLDFIDIYAALDENERILYTQRYPQEAADMSGFAQRFIEQGIEKGIEQGVQRGEARMLMSLLRLRFGELPDAVQQRIESADADTLLHWSERVLTAVTLAEVLDGTC
ncbi:conserved hypothetical protein [Thiocapsa sp. KS1]|nr:DUF4351 domain-containing protein [Thiocapsa sp. KS1]CRI62850.1 conserved hypothetical protein [Thiocapsa sp. KS1]